MPNTILKAEQIAATALGLLQRELVVPNLVWGDAVDNWAGAKDDTVSIRVPARLTARTRALRGTGGARTITLDNLTETKVDVTLDTDIYSGVPVTDEELTLDISNFGTQVLSPQVRAVAEGVENAIVDEMQGATYVHNIVMSATDPFDGAVDARKALNDENVPMSGRALLVGSAIEAAFLKSDRFARVDQSGSDNALREAQIGRVAGFDVYTSNALDEDEGFAFHRTAFILGMRAPQVPDGVAFGASQSYQGLAMRWIRDYDFANVQDRSLVDTFVGTATVSDGPGSTLVRAVSIDFHSGS